MIKALQKLGRRAATVMYEQKQWFTWIKQCQEKEDEEAENESKKVKLESLLFKRHQKEIYRHRREMRSRENGKRHEQYLNKVYIQRISEMSEEEQDEWDPIQDVYGYEKENYMDLIKFFLMLDHQEQTGESPAEDEESQVDASLESKPAEKSLSKSTKKRARRANADPHKKEDNDTASTDNQDTNFIEMETREQMRKRLRSPVKFERKGFHMIDKRDTARGGAPMVQEDEI
jgi:hypothetical protein